MNTEEAIKELTALRNLLGTSKLRFRDRRRTVVKVVTDRDELEDEITRNLPVIEAIASEEDDRLVHPLRTRTQVPGAWPYIACERAVAELLGILENESRIAEIVGPSGPALSASRMHHWVWDHASALWDDGHRRAAVQAAATAIFDSYLPGKLGVVGWEPERLASTFKPAEQSGELRLRIGGFTDPDDWRSAHRGAHYLGLACASLVRNIRTHNIAEPEENVGLEELAMLSRFAHLAADVQVEICQPSSDADSAAPAS